MADSLSHGPTGRFGAGFLRALAEGLAGYAAALIVAMLLSAASGSTTLGDVLAILGWVWLGGRPAWRLNLLEFGPRIARWAAALIRTGAMLACLAISAV